MIQNIKQYLQSLRDVEEYKYSHNITKELEELFPLGTKVYDMWNKYLGKVVGYENGAIQIECPEGNDYCIVRGSVIAHRIKLD